MFLHCIKAGQSLRERLLAPLRRVLGIEGPTDITATMRYRPGLFGDPFWQLQHAVMRGPSTWTVAERELMAAYVSRLNRCPFCAESHTTAAATLIGDRASVESALADPGQSHLDPKLRATLGFLEILTKRPADVSPDDVDRLRTHGVTDNAVLEAAYVCVVFSIIVRVANGLGFTVPPAAYLEKRARALAARVGAEHSAHTIAEPPGHADR